VNQKGKIKVIWPVETPGGLEFVYANRKSSAMKRAAALRKVAPEYGPYEVVKFVRASR
jgi:hypothetical protein